MLTPDPVQSSYARYATEAQAGMPANANGLQIDTRLVEGAALGFGLAVSQGDADAGVLLGGVSGRVFVGVTRCDQTLLAKSEDKYPLGDNCNVIVVGDVWVAPDDAIDPTMAVYFDPDTGHLGAGGGTLIANARWMTSVQSGGFAILRLANAAGGF